MLDAFLEVLVEKEARHSTREEMADAFMALPVEELHKLASGSMKLADFDDHDWLSKFKGTPLYEPALQLEQQCLELDIQGQQSQQARSQESQQDKAIWDAKDGIRLKKRMLDLELLKMESSTTAGSNIASGAPPAPDKQQEQAAAQPAPQGVAGAPMENVPKMASMKAAAQWPTGAAGPSELAGAVVGKAKTNINQLIGSTLKGVKKVKAAHVLHKVAAESHSTLEYVREHGTPEEKAQVFEAVTKRSSSGKHEAPKHKLAETIFAMRMEKVALSMPSSRTLSALAGAAGGAGVGALTGGASEPGGQSHRLRNALIGAGVGTGVGLGGHALASRLGGAAPAAAAAEHIPASAAAPTSSVRSSGTIFQAPAGMEAAAASAPAPSSGKFLPKREGKFKGMGIGDPGAEMRAALQAPPVTPTENLLHVSTNPTGMANNLRRDTWVSPPGMTVTASVLQPAAVEAMEVADAWGRQMAMMEKSALPALGAITGALRGLAGKAAPFATKAVQAARANPALATAALGAGVGAVGGAVGAEKGHRLGGALKGGVLGGAVGGAAGYAAPKVMGHMGMGHSLGGAMKATGQEAMTGARGLGQRAMSWATPAAQ